MRYLLTDDLWTALEPHVLQAKRHRGGQPPRLPERAFFEALLYLARTGVPWRDLPSEFGRWDAVYNRFRPLGRLRRPAAAVRGAHGRQVPARAEQAFLGVFHEQDPGDGGDELVALL